MKHDFKKMLETIDQQIAWVTFQMEQCNPERDRYNFLLESLQSWKTAREQAVEAQNLEKLVLLIETKPTKESL